VLEGKGTRWTSTFAAPRGAPFAGLNSTLEPTPPDKTREGVALVVLGLGLWALWTGIRNPSAMGLSSDFVVRAYPNERRRDIGWGSAQYRKAVEYQVIDRDHGTSKSFWSKKEARKYIQESGGNPARAGL